MALIPEAKCLKFQVNLFFIVAIIAMILKLISGCIEDAISFKNKDKDESMLYNDEYRKFFWLGLLNLISDLSFTGLILSYLMSIGVRER